LVRQGFESLVKEQLLSKQKYLKFKEVMTNDLPGYVFVRTKEIKDQVNDYLVFDGVLKFLGISREGPQEFTTEQIRNLNVSNIELKREHRSFKKGDHVIIKKGDLADIDGTVVEVRKRVLRIQPAIFHKIIKVRVQDVDYI
jgi:transcription antitermination factor NusG